MRLFACFTVIAALVAGAASSADVPGKMSFQGRVSNLSGEWLSGDHEFTFRLYDDRTGGTLLWTDTDSLEVCDGDFHAYLGENTPLPSDIFSSGRTLWLETEIDGATLPERQLLGSVAYSFHADKADTAVFAYQSSSGDTSNVWDADGNNVYLLNKKVGIGTENPEAKLHVKGSVDLGDGTRITARLGSDWNHWTYFGNGNSGRIRGNGEGYLVVSTNPDGSGDKDLYLEANHVGAKIRLIAPTVTHYGSDFCIINPERGSGGRAVVHWLENVLCLNFDGDYSGGVRVMGPGLEVDGTTTTSTLHITGGSDIAEPFDVTGPGETLPGMVMVIDRDDPGRLSVAEAAYDPCVAGIISGGGGIRPGVLMGQTGTIADGEHPLAVSGRVYCRADASYAPIRPGDRLTTSPTRGHAMKATDHSRAPGAVLGKAMTELESGQGLVLVLVTLQ